MSQIKLSPAASGAGVFTIASPATATDRTLNLPDSDGTVIATAPGTSGNVLTSNGTTWTSAAAPAGVTYATSAEAIAGTSNTVAISPLQLRNGFNASGSAPVYACRAWVNFDGTGTVAIRASGNVSSITDNGTGDYTVNFTTAMQDANYSAMSVNQLHAYVSKTISPTTSGFSIVSEAFSGSLTDYAYISAAVFR